MRKLAAIFCLGVGVFTISAVIAQTDGNASRPWKEAAANSSLNKDASGAQACSSLMAQSAWSAFPDPTTVITSAVLQPAAAPSGTAPAHPAHCEVLGTIHARISRIDGQPYAIKFHMRLPVSAQWNGRFFFEGGGGYNGRLGDAFGPIGGHQVKDGLSLGFAVIATDSGHDNKIDNNPNAGGTLSFGADPQARSDFFYYA
jgi:feruloyl esterase